MIDASAGKADAFLRADAQDDAAVWRRRAEFAAQRVDELRAQVQKQTNLRVAAEQRAGAKNVAETERAFTRAQRLAWELRQQLNEAHAEIDRLNGLLGDRDAAAAFGPWPE